jgi:SGNH domain (fused to AT3 domains)
VTVLQPALVVLASAADDYIDDHNVGLALGGRFTRDADEKTAVWQSGLRHTIESMTTARPGLKVIIVDAVPKDIGWDARECAALWVATAPERCASTFDRDGALTRRSRSVSANALAANGRAEILDVFDLVCPDDPCTTYANGEWILRDGEHISRAQAEKLTPAFTIAISKALAIG